MACIQLRAVPVLTRPSLAAAQRRRAAAHPGLLSARCDAPGRPARPPPAPGARYCAPGGSAAGQRACAAVCDSYVRPARERAPALPAAACAACRPPAAAQTAASCAASAEGTPGEKDARATLQPPPHAASSSPPSFRLRLLPRSVPPREPACCLAVCRQRTATRSSDAALCGATTRTLVFFAASHGRARAARCCARRGRRPAFRRVGRARRARRAVEGSAASAGA